MFNVGAKKKLSYSEITKTCGCCTETGCFKCSPKIFLVDKMADALIPEGYWLLPYNNFLGSKIIKGETLSYIGNLDKNFQEGKGLCYAGSPGTGKTMSATTVLKAALNHGYSAHYTTLSDIAFYLSDNAYKMSVYHTLIGADFLCIDEVDSRHFADSEASESFFGRTLERVFRYRVQNRLPMILATNNTSLTDVFAGQFSKILTSISLPAIKTIICVGKDFRELSGAK